MSVVGEREPEVGIDEASPRRPNPIRSAAIVAGMVLVGVVALLVFDRAAEVVEVSPTMTT